MPFGHPEGLELCIDRSTRLVALRHLAPATLLCLAGALCLVNDPLLPVPVLLAVYLLKRELAGLDPAGIRQKSCSDGWRCNGGPETLHLRCRARFDTCMWLELRCPSAAVRQLLLCDDAITPRQWRLLRRHLTLFPRV